MTTKWIIDAAHSTIGFSVRHLVFATARGRFLKFSGVIHLDDDVTRSWVDATIDVASVDTGTPQRDARLRSRDFFDAAAFPKIFFRSTMVEDLGHARLRAIGGLTMRGITIPIAVDVEVGVVHGGHRIGFSARTQIDRTIFGLGWNQVFEAGGLVVGDLIKIELDIEAVRVAAAERAA